MSTPGGATRPAPATSNVLDGADGYQHTSPSEGSPRTARGWGAFDMGGNVHEWTADWRGPLGPEPLVDPTGPAEGKVHVARGGAWVPQPGRLQADAPHELRARRDRLGGSSVSASRSRPPRRGVSVQDDVQRRVAEQAVVRHALLQRFLTPEQVEAARAQGGELLTALRSALSSEQQAALGAVYRAALGRLPARARRLVPPAGGRPALARPAVGGPRRPRGPARAPKRRPCGMDRWRRLRPWSLVPRRPRPGPPDRATPRSPSGSDPTPSSASWRAAGWGSCSWHGTWRSAAGSRSS